MWVVVAGLARPCNCALAVTIPSLGGCLVLCRSAVGRWEPAGVGFCFLWGGRDAGRAGLCVRLRLAEGGGCVGRRVAVIGSQACNCARLETPSSGDCVCWAVRAGRGLGTSAELVGCGLSGGGRGAGREGLCVRVRLAGGCGGIVGGVADVVLVGAKPLLFST